MVTIQVLVPSLPIQDKPYHFEEAPALHEHLIKFHFLDTDILYDVSLQREPRYG